LTASKIKTQSRLANGSQPAVAYERSHTSNSKTIFNFSHHLLTPAANSLCMTQSLLISSLFSNHFLS